MKQNPSPLTDNESLQLCLERDRLLCNPEFERSPTMSKLLKFLVDHRLSDSTTALKAYTIAVDALGRQESFDTETDSYPRVQISRLRRVLDNFYLREGGANRLSIPQNSYEIAVLPNPSNETDSDTLDTEGMIGTQAAQSKKDQEVAGPFPLGQQHNKWKRLSNKIAIAIGLFAILFASSLAYFLKPPEHEKEITYPVVIVMDTSGIVNEVTRGKAKAIQAYFISTLTKFDQIRVHTVETRDKNRPIYHLQSSILNTEGRRIHVQLVDTRSNGLIWSDDYSLDSKQPVDTYLANAVIAIAGPFGAVAQAELSKHREDYTPGFPCLLQFHQYIRYRNEAILAPALSCMQKSVNRFPNDPYMLSMLALAKSVPKQFGTNTQIDGTSRDLARRAVQLDSLSASAVFAVAQIAFFEGDCAIGVSRGKRAVELNPLNSRIMGYLGLYMLGCKLPEGEEYASRALDMDPNVDMAIGATLAFQYLRRGKTLEAQQLSEKYMALALQPEPGLELTYVLSTAMLGDKLEARRVWERHTARFGFDEDAPVRTVLGQWIANPFLIDEIMLVFDKIELYN